MSAIKFYTGKVTLNAYDCVICSGKDTGDYVIDTQNKKHDGHEWLDVTKRACKKCWVPYQAFLSKLKAHVDYGTPKPGLPKNIHVRRFVLANQSVKYLFKSELKSAENVITLSGSQNILHLRVTR
jgi:hypothetical protein